MRVNQ